MLQSSVDSVEAQSILPRLILGAGPARFLEVARRTVVSCELNYHVNLPSAVAKSKSSSNKK